MGLPAPQLLTAVLLAAAPNEDPSFAPSAEDRALLQSLRRGHPRVVLTPESLRSLRGALQADAGTRSLLDALRASGGTLLKAPPVERVLAGPRLLQVSRRCLDRVATLGLLHLLDPASARGSPRAGSAWSDRAAAEMRAAAGFSDWNPSHFLDVAEMTFALALGYDWLHDALSDGDRAEIRNAIVEKGLKPAARCHASNAWWARCRHNWNQVCNGGTLGGALAVADEEPALAAFVLGRALRSLPLAMASFAPDGGWAEGPGYWGYTTQYTTYLLAALDSALGKDFGLASTPGFRETAGFRAASEGPIRLAFNYADCGERSGRVPQAFWLARRFGESFYADLARRAMGTSPSAFDLLWFVPSGAMSAPAPPPRDAVYRGIDVAFFRSDWNDPNAVFVGFKGGDNAANHSHLDLGTFVLDADGVRWASDLGGDDYNLPGYFGKDRWSYYRLRTEGHNVVTVGGSNQAPKARAPIVAFASASAGPRIRAPSAPLGGAREAAFAVADLTAAYAGQARAALRGVALLDRRDVLIQDEFTLDRPAELVWAMHTRASVKAEGRTAVLTQGGKRSTVRLLAPPDAAFAAGPAQGKGSPNPGVTKLTVPVKAGGTTTFAVIVSPGDGGGPIPAPIERLADWIARGRLIRAGGKGEGSGDR